MSAPIFTAAGLGKRYSTHRRGFRRQAAPAWALRHVDVEVNPPEVVAVIGRNGAGKSTLLKIAAGVSTQTEGLVVRPARIAPLIEVGAGFHPDLTGRENIEVNARLMGLTAREVRLATPGIIEFSGLVGDIDRSVREYSSGMFMRLGFAVAIHTNPDLLIVDEVLAVGDLPFQARCLARIQDLRQDGAGVLFVSHNLAAVLNIADKAILLELGEVRSAGESREVVGAYHDLLARAHVSRDGTAEPGSLELEDIRMVAEDDEPRSLWDPGQRVSLDMTFRATEATGPLRLGFKVHHEEAGVVSSWSNREGEPLPGLEAGQAKRFRLHLRLWLGEGAHHVELTVATDDLSRFLYTRQDSFRFAMGARPGGRGLVDLDPQLEVVDAG